MVLYSISVLEAQLANLKHVIDRLHSNASEDNQEPHVQKLYNDRIDQYKAKVGDLERALLVLNKPRLVLPPTAGTNS